MTPALTENKNRRRRQSMFAAALSKQPPPSAMMDKKASTCVRCRAKKIVSRVYFQLAWPRVSDVSASDVTAKILAARAPDAPK
jgi:hypothetical protein